jgi:hypothetical protein
MRRITLGCTALVLALSGPALAKTIKFHATLSPASEVPPAQDTGSGEATATLDTKTHALSYTLTFQGFATKVTMAHFHGPAAADKNAKVQLPLGTDPTSPLSGTAKLTPEQEKQLESGLWYANLHTTANPKGAARGQLEEVK